MPTTTIQNVYEMANWITGRHVFKACVHEAYQPPNVGAGFSAVLLMCISDIKCSMTKPPVFHIPELIGPLKMWK